MLELSIFRNKTLRTATLVADGQPNLTKYLIRQLPDASPEQKENFKIWLNQEF